MPIFRFRNRVDDSMLQLICMLHIAALSVATLIATIQITSIVVSGWICSMIGIVAGVLSLHKRQIRIGGQGRRVKKQCNNA